MASGNVSAATGQQRGSHGNATMTSIADLEMSMTTHLYFGSVVDYTTSDDDDDVDGWSVALGGSVWWPDETPWFRVLLIILYGAVFIGCVVGMNIHELHLKYCRS